MNDGFGVSDSIICAINRDCCEDKARLVLPSPQFDSFHFYFAFALYLGFGILISSSYEINRSNIKLIREEIIVIKISIFD